MRSTIPVLVVALAFLSLTASLRAQTASPSASPTATTGTSSNPRIWKCVIPGGTYEVAVRDIISVAVSQYIVNGSANVTELNIDTPGNSLVRFYYIEPITSTAISAPQTIIDKAQDLANQASNYTGIDAWEKVQKTYPTSTHAHTVEYRMNSIDELNQLFKSVENAFTKGTGSTVVINPPTSASPATPAP